MARKGVAILRDIQLVEACSQPQVIKVAMLRQLNDELASIYAPSAAPSLTLPSAVGHDLKPL